MDLEKEMADLAKVDRDIAYAIGRLVRMRRETDDLRANSRRCAQRNTATAQKAAKAE